MASYKSRVIDVTIVNRLRNKGAICLQICRSIPQITAASSAARTLK